MSRFTSLVASVITAFTFLATLAVPAWSQRGQFAGPPRGQATTATTQGGSQGEDSHNRRGGETASVGKANPAPASAPAPAPLFPTRLGNTVGIQPLPMVMNPPITPFGMPGYGNINQPGLPPLAPPAIPNINSPGIPPTAGGSIPGFGNTFGGSQPGGQHRPGSRPGGRQGEFRGRGNGGPVVIPYYYYVPSAPYNMGYGYGTPQTAPEPAAPPSPEQPEEAEPPVHLHLDMFPDPSTGGQPGEMPPNSSPAETQPSEPSAPQPKPVTILAFKDQTLVAVTDYWLKGDQIYYKRNDTGVGIPLDQLDFPLTQQLNRERNVPFVLESRP